MKLIMGLGNPGEKYVKTRHNLGFMVVDELARKFSIFNFQFSMNKTLKAEILKTQHDGEEIVLVKTQTFMNECGWAVAKILRYYDINPPVGLSVDRVGEAGILSDLWVVHDDLDLPLGKIKIRVGGGTAGHHGLESIVKHLGTTDFVRFRLGIGKPGGHGEWQKDTAKRKGIENYVLSEFHTGEQGKVREMIKKAVKAIEVALKDGLEKAMNRFNQ